MGIPAPKPEKIVEDNVVDRLEYFLDEEGRVHVRGVPGIGDKVVHALRAHGYDLVLREGYYLPRS